MPTARWIAQAACAGVYPAGAYWHLRGRVPRLTGEEHGGAQADKA